MKRLQVCLVLLAVMTAGCMARTLSIHTKPEGALVEVNHRVIGRTPIKDFAFHHYGTYQIILKKRGFKEKKILQPVQGPWHQYIPIDLVVELLPVTLKDARTFSYTLEPLPPVSEDALLKDAERMRHAARELMKAVAVKPPARPAVKKKPDKTEIRVIEEPPAPE